MNGTRFSEINLKVVKSVGSYLRTSTLSTKPAINNCLSFFHLTSTVVLSPYGLSASVTGHSLSINDIKASKLLDEWSKFYPALVNDESTANGFPPVVEVIRGETRMLYPSNLVLVPIKKSDFGK